MRGFRDEGGPPPRPESNLSDPARNMAKQKKKNAKPFWPKSPTFDDP